MDLIGVNPPGVGTVTVSAGMLVVVVSVTLSVVVCDCVEVIVTKAVEVVLNTCVGFDTVTVFVLVCTTRTVEVLGRGFLVIVRVEVMVSLLHTTEVHLPFHDLTQSGDCRIP